MIPDGRGTPFYFKTSFVDSQVLSASSNQITLCFSIVQGMAARTLKLVNNRRAYGNRKTVFKRKEGSNAFWGPKNNPQLDIWIAFFNDST